MATKTKEKPKKQPIRDKGANRPDTIREALAARAEELGMTAYQIGQHAEIDPGTIKRFLDGMNRDGKRVCIGLNSRYVSAICDVLGLELKIKKGC